MTLIALKELAKVLHKRPELVTHGILIPRLLYQEEWRKRFKREGNIWFPLMPGEVWSVSAYEPLMIGISFSLYSSSLW